MRLRFIHALLSAGFIAAVQGAGSARAVEGVAIARAGDLVDLAIAEPAPLPDVLAALADAYGASIEGGSPQESVGPIRLVGVTLAEALTRVLPSHSFAMKLNSQSGAPETIIVLGAIKNAAASLDESTAPGLPGQDCAGLPDRLQKPHGRDGRRQIAAEGNGCPPGMVPLEPK